MPGPCNAGIAYRLPSRRPRGDHDHSHRHAPLNVYRFAPLSSPRGGHVIRTRRLSRSGWSQRRIAEHLGVTRYRVRLALA